MCKVTTDNIRKYFFNANHTFGPGDNYNSENSHFIPNFKKIYEAKNNNKNILICGELENQKEN